MNPGGTGGCYASIQDAIDAAGPGDTVLVYAGTYTGLLTIDKPLTLIGEDAEPMPRIVVPVGVTNIHTPGINVRASDVTIQSLWISQEDWPADSAIFSIPRGGTWPSYTVEHARFTLRDCLVQGGRRAMFATVRDVLIEGCSFVGQARDSLFFNAVAGTTLIRHNYFTGASDKSILFENFSSGDPECSGTIRIEYNTSNRKVNFLVWDQWLGDNTPKLRLLVRHNTCDRTNSAAIAFWAGALQDPGAFNRFQEILIQDNLASNGGRPVVYVDYTDYGVGVDPNLKPIPADGQIVANYTLAFNNAPSGTTDPTGSFGFDSGPDGPPGASMAMFALSNNLLGNPLYADPAHNNADFSVLPPSPARCAASDGTTIGAWQDPICRLSRRCACALPPTPGDIDSDWVPDAVEFDQGVVFPLIGSNRYLWDSDGDGLADGYEDANLNGVVDPGETDTRLRDSDGDGIWDGVEAVYLLTDGTDPSSPVAVVDADGDGLPLGLDPNDSDPDTDGDRFTDGIEAVMCGLGSVSDANVYPPFGDVNCDGYTTNLDSLIINSLFLGITPHGGVPGESNGDVNRDGFYTNLDALMITVWMLKLSNYLPYPLF